MSTTLTTPAQQQQRLFGMFELDAWDTVIYARVEGGGAPPPSAPHDPLGHALFEWAEPFANAAELRDCLQHFRSSGAAADSFDFECQYEDGHVPVRVLLARVRDCADRRETKSILVHIRPRG